MRLTKLEINGFKSFARRTEVEFEPGITAIIGPNGSGKSNIADAVRWVLGEQSARALRGSKMEDVIFAGTEQRRQLSYCEVTLTFDNADKKLPTDFLEVAVTRRVYRSGDSEYLINKTPCRLKDIGELFRDTGIGKEGYSIIGQGRVEEILSNKSGARRAAFEEAAGVMRYRVRKEEAERKLESTKKNLIRLGDITDGLSEQLGPLEEQSASAREFLKLRDELKDIEINIFLYQYDRLSERTAQLREQLEQLSQELLTASAVDTRMASECAHSEERERAMSEAISKLQTELLALSSGVEARSGEAGVISEKMAAIVRDRERTDGEAKESIRRHSELSIQIEDARGACDENRKVFSKSYASLNALEAELDKIQSSIDQKEELLEAQKNSMIEAMNRLSDAKSRISSLTAIRGTIIERSEQVKELEAKVMREGEKLSAEYDEVCAKQNEIEQKRDAAEAKRAKAVSDTNDAAYALKTCEADIAKAQQETSAAVSRLRVLEEMKKAHEGYYASVKNLLSDAARTPELGSRIEGVVAELLHVPAEYETALEMAMGSALQNIVTKNEQDAKYAIEYLRRRDYGRATFLPMTSMRSRLLNDQERASLRTDGCIGVASELIGFDEKYRGVMENLLGRTVIVRDLDAGIAINRQSHSAFRIATLKGDIINPGGSMTGGSAGKREYSLIGRQRETDELRQRIEEMARAKTAAENRRTELNTRLTEANGRVMRCTQEVHAWDVDVAAHREKVDIVKKYADENDERLADTREEYGRLMDSVADIDAQCSQAEDSRTELEAGNYASQDDIKRTQEELSAMRQSSADVSARVTMEKISLASLEKEYSAQQNELRRMEREASSLLAGAREARAKSDKAASELASLDQRLSELGARIEVERGDLDQLTDRLHSMEDERTRLITALDELRKRRYELSVQLEEARDKKHKSELNLSKTEMELSSIQDRIWEDYELTYENAAQFRRQIAVTASHVRVDELKRDIRALGDVNVGAIEDYRVVKERYDELTAQCADLTKAEEDLRQLIDELVTTMETEFKKQFELIQSNFAVVFAELFGGGKAELVLADENDILNCEIDIIAQPPGKKLQLLSLLSGGERALTAIALLFAILKLKPTAFCILDEIESSLDEVNVSNFARYVKSYSKDTQFILITHRKGSMEVCDALYGVAMEEKGVSKVVSARFVETSITA